MKNVTKRLAALLLCLALLVSCLAVAEEVEVAPTEAAPASSAAPVEDEATTSGSEIVPPPVM